MESRQTENKVASSISYHDCFLYVVCIRRLYLTVSVRGAFINVPLFELHACV